MRQSFNARIVFKQKQGHHANQHPRGLTPIKHIDPLYINDFHFRLLSTRIHALLSPPTLYFAKNVKSWKPISSTKMSENASKRRAFSSAWGGSRCAWAVTEMVASLGMFCGSTKTVSNGVLTKAERREERKRERERERESYKRANAWPLTHPCPILYTRNGFADQCILFGFRREQ